MTGTAKNSESVPRNGLGTFLQSDAAAGLILAGAALFAILIFNIEALSPYYRDILQATLRVGLADAELSKPLLLWINDGLMAIFFLLIGLELKREVLEGSLSSRDQIVLPALAAVGGMAVPALVYLLVNGGDPVLLKGWAIPAATDIAFALGALSLAGRSVPVSLKVFLLTLATLDDLGAIIIIAAFYTSKISTGALALAAIAVVILVILNRIRYSSAGLYMIVGAILWLCVLESGVHATLAGVIIGLSIPMTRRDGTPFLDGIEHALKPHVKFMILPLFAFANAGLPLADLLPERALEPLPLGIAAGLTVGKPIGILAACWIAVRFHLAGLPKGCNWAHILGVGLLAGIGFTMSLFIGSLAFVTEEQLTAVRAGVIYGSLLSGLIGIITLLIASRISPSIAGASGNIHG